MDDLAAEHAIRANLPATRRPIRVLDRDRAARASLVGAAATAASRLEAAVRLSGDVPPAQLPAELGEAL